MAGSVYTTDQFSDDNGVPIADGSLSFFVTPDTTTEITIYDDDLLSSVIGNPVALDGSGRPETNVFFSDSCRLVVKDSDGNQVSATNSFQQFRNENDFDFDSTKTYDKNDIVLDPVSGS